MENKLKRLVNLMVLLFGMSFLHAQQAITITASFSNTAYRSATLIGFAPAEHSVATADIRAGKMELRLPADVPHGIYRLFFNPEISGYVDIIINGEQEVSFGIDASGKVEFTKSTVNRLFQHYLNDTGISLSKAEQLRYFLMNYPDKKDKIYTDVRKALVLEEKVLTGLSDKYVSVNKGTVSSLFVKNRKFRLSNPDVPMEKQDYDIHNSFWNGIDTSSDALLNTPLYSDLIFEYVTLSMRQKDGIANPEKALKDAIDVIMQKFDSNDPLKQFALDYLTTGLKQTGQDEVLQYLDEKYRAQCESAQNAGFEARMAAYNSLRPGMKAPDIEQLRVKEVYGKRIVLAFWAGWCPHCTQEMPQLNAAIGNFQDTVVIAISLDEDKKLYQEASSGLKNMFHFCDLRKWEGEAVKKYHISGTPTFFILDKDKTILGKYTTVSSLLKAL